ncbi:MAG TPA: GNAT family N-acetyltransferase [Cellvibrio sp.]|nr:GNAT family N-acetyltransferase [Cellvibrio sp.]
MSFSIRLMAQGDLTAVEDIQAEAYAGYFLESAEVIAQRFHISPATAWVAEREGQVCAYLVGYCSLLGKINPLDAPFAPAENPDCLYLHDMAILKVAQGAGIAKALLQAAERLAGVKQLGKMALLSVQDSKAFWLGQGFVIREGLDSVQQQNLNSYCDADEMAFYMVKGLQALDHGHAPDRPLGQTVPIF